MTLSRGLLIFSAGAFGAIGVAYLVAPGAMLAVVGIASEPTKDFLMRTEGVALLTGAGLLWAVRDGAPSQLRLVLLVLAGYFVLGSLVDLAAFSQGIVGAAAVPSAAIRIAVGVVCAWAGVSRTRVVSR